MYKDFEIIGIESYIKEDSLALEYLDDIKPGDSIIEIRYCDYGDSEFPYVGSIFAYSNGIISLTVANKKYMNRLYADYANISGIIHEPKPMEFTPYAEVQSPDRDVERYARAKQFLKDRRIELKYSSEVELEREDYERLEDLTIDDLVNNSNSLEERDYDEGEYHHLL